METTKLRIIYFIAVFYLCMGILRSDDFPYEIQLKEDTQFSIITGGKTVGSIKATNGTTVVALSLSNDNVEIKYKDFTNTIALNKTNLQDVMDLAAKEESERKLRKQEKQEAQSASLLAEKQQKEATEHEELFKNAQRSIRVLKKYISSYPVEEQVVLTNVITNNEEFVSKYTNATPDKRSVIANEFKNKCQTLLDSRPIYGFRYNEILHRDTITPVDFNIYKNNDGIYIEVGSGDFCTVADIPLEEFGKILESQSTLFRWSKQCSNDSMNAEKELYKSQSITMEFVSQDNGDNQFIRVSVSGPFSKRSLLSSQNIIMTKMNFFALINKMTKAEQMLKERLNLKSNSDKLK